MYVGTPLPRLQLIKGTTFATTFIGLAVQRVRFAKNHPEFRKGHERFLQTMEESQGKLLYKPYIVSIYGFLAYYPQESHLIFLVHPKRFNSSALKNGVWKAIPFPLGFGIFSGTMTMFNFRWLSSMEISEALFVLKTCSRVLCETCLLK